MTTTYGVDAQGSRARWYTGGMTLPEALRYARHHLRYAPDTATVYRRPESEWRSGPSEVLARYTLRRVDPNGLLALYVTRPGGRLYCIGRLRRWNDPTRWRPAP